MNNLENFDDGKNEFKENVFFNDGRMTPKNDSMIYDGMIKFYTVFDYEHDFKEIIEKNSPLKVEYQNA